MAQTQTTESKEGKIIITVTVQVPELGTQKYEPPTEAGLQLRPPSEQEQSNTSKRSSCVSCKENASSSASSELADVAK